MEKYYLSSIQSKVNPSQNEPVLVPVNEVAEFISSNLRPDSVIIVSQCSVFNSTSDDDEK